MADFSQEWLREWANQVDDEGLDVTDQIVRVLRGRGYIVAKPLDPVIDTVLNDDHYAVGYEDGFSGQSDTDPMCGYLESDEWEVGCTDGRNAALAILHEASL